MRRLLSCACLVVLTCTPVFADSHLAVEVPQPTTPRVFKLGPLSPSARAPVSPVVPPTPCLDGSAVEGIDVVSMLLTYGYGAMPPDANCAVGPAHVINVTNNVIQWRPTANPQDTPEFEEPLAYFFGLVDSLTGYAYTTDPKVIYDQYDGRFALVLMGGAFDPGPWLLAVSKTSDPNDGWWRYTFARYIVVNGTTYYADYPGLAIDDKAIYLTADMYTGSGVYYGPHLWIIPKMPSLYTGPDGTISPPSYDLKARALGTTTMQPAHMFGVMPAGALGAPFGTFLVSYGGASAGGIEAIRVVSVNDPLGTAGGPILIGQLLSCGDIDNTFASTSGAPQLGTSTLIHSGERQVFNAVWRNNSLYLGADCVPPSGPDAGQVTAHWWRVATAFDGVNSPALALADQGNVGAEDLGAGTYTYYPRVMVDVADNLAVGFSASGTSLYAGAYFATRCHLDPAGTISGTCTLAPGVDYYIRTFPPDTRNRWGDYTGLALSPGDESTFWVYNEYAEVGGFENAGGTQGQGIWHTKLGKFQVPCPTSVAITSFAATASDDFVTLRGAFHSDLGAEAVVVYRGEGVGALSEIETIRPSGSGFEYVDRDVTPGSTYRYRIGVVDADGEFYSPIETVSLRRARTALWQNYPNPFNPTTEIPFALGEAGRVSLDIYDAAGHLVRRLVEGFQGPGKHKATWDGRDEQGHAAGSGVHFCRLHTGAIVETRRLVLVK